MNEFSAKGRRVLYAALPRGLSRRMDEYESKCRQANGHRPGLAGHVDGHPFAMGVFSVAQAQTTHSAERIFSADTVIPGGEVTVTINVMDYTGNGLVEETLPAGFSIGNSTPSPFRTQGVVSLWAFEEGVETITYTATAPSQPGTYNFMGTFTSGSPASTVDIGGTSGITVAEAATGGDDGAESEDPANSREPGQTCGLS